MDLLLARSSPSAPAHTQLQLVVVFYAVSYLGSVLVGLTCLGLRSLLGRVPRCGGGHPPGRDQSKQGWGGPRSPLVNRDDVKDVRLSEHF